MSPVRINSIPIGSANVERGRTALGPAATGKSFGDTLQAQLLEQGVKLSGHAQKRLAERDVQLSQDDTVRLGAAVDRAQQKGADKSLVLMDDLALVVSARNRVIITALDSASAKEGVFTGIDSAVIA